MLVNLSIIYPLLMAFIMIGVMPYTLNNFFTVEEQLRIRSHLKRIEDDRRNRISRIGVTLFFILIPPITLGQYLLVHALTNLDSSVLMANHAWDNLNYSAMPSIFLALSGSYIATLHYTYLKDGRDQIREDLLSVMNHIPNYINLKYFKLITLSIGIIFSLINYITYDTYISVNKDNISYSKFMSLRKYTIGYDAIDCIIQYKWRIAPYNEIVHKSYLDIYMQDGSVIDTFYLIEGNQQREFFKAVEQAAHRHIPFLKIKTTREDANNNNCKGAR